MKIVTTAAYPFIPAELLLAHIASTYLPADVYHRFMKKSGCEAYLVCATDVHGVWVKREAQKENVSTQSIIEKWHGIYQKQFSDLHIKFDIYSQTDTKDLHDVVNHSLNKLRNDSLIELRNTDSYYCQSCHEFLPKRLRLKAVDQSNTGKLKYGNVIECGFCGGDDVKSDSSPHWFMKLNSSINDINIFLEKQNLPYIKSSLAAFVRDDLDDWNFTRDKGYHGIKLPFQDSDHRLYLWYDSLLCYITLIPPNIKLNEVSFRHFMGKNILYYHGVVWPFLLKNVFQEQPKDIQLSARGFLNIDKSSHQLIKIEEALKIFPADFVRFYLSYKTPDSMVDYYFDMVEMKVVINSIVCNQIGSFFQRCLAIFEKYNLTHVPHGEKSSDLWVATLAEVKHLISQTKIRAALLSIQKYVKRCGEFINSSEIYKKEDLDNLALLSQLMAGALLLLSVYMPGKIREFDCFNLKFESFDEASSLGGCQIARIESVWDQIK